MTFPDGSRPSARGFPAPKPPRRRAARRAPREIEDEVPEEEWTHVGKSRFVTLCGRKRVGTGLEVLPVGWDDHTTCPDCQRELAKKRARDEEVRRILNESLGPGSGEPW